MSPGLISSAGSRIGVLLVNLGTPDATDYWSMRRYLKEFLSDRRVIEENRLKWWLALNLIILTVRPGRKGRDYDKIWNRKLDEGDIRCLLTFPELEHVSFTECTFDDAALAPLSQLKRLRGLRLGHARL